MQKSSRPVSPHLFGAGGRLHYRWGPHMLVSILHRATGSGLAVVGGIGLAAWLASVAAGPESYAGFVDCVTSDRTGKLNWLPALVLIGLTWAFFQHLLSGLRHFVLDIGAGYELQTNRNWATLTVVGSVVLTALVWAYILFGRG